MSKLNEQLFNALNEGNSSRAYELMKVGVNIKAPGYNYLLSAIQHCTGMVSFLIASGVAVNEKDEKGNTPLHCAAENNLTRFIRPLVAQGAHVNSQNNMGMTPLDRAMSCGNKKFAETLIEYVILENHQTEKPYYITSDNNLSKRWDNQAKKEIFLLNNKSIFDSMSKYSNYVINRNESLDSLVSDAENFLKKTQKKIKEKFSAAMNFNGIIEYRVNTRYPSSLKALALGNVPFERYEALSGEILNDLNVEQAKVGPVID